MGAVKNVFFIEIAPTFAAAVNRDLKLKPAVFFGGKINLIGNIIEQEFTVNSNWYLGSGLSLVMMVFIILSMLMLQKFDKTGGANLI